MPSIVAIPSDIDKKAVLDRILRKLVEELDSLVGARGSDPALRESTFTNAQTSIAALEAQVDAISNSATSVQEALEQANRDISALSTVTEEEILQLRGYWTSAVLDSTYYDFDATEWDSLIGNFEFTVNYESLANAPYARQAPLPAVEIYSHYIVTLPSVAGKSVMRMLVCTNGGALLHILHRAQGTWL